MTQREILWYADIIRACQENKRVAVLNSDNNVIEGVARHIVSPNHAGFADNVTPECRVRVTAMMEHFIPIQDIVPGYRALRFGGC